MSLDEPSLARLMAASQRGDRAAYRALLGDCRTWLARYFARRIAPHQVDDLIQETLVSMHRKLATWDSDRAFLPWLAAIARRLGEEAERYTPYQRGFAGRANRW